MVKTVLGSTADGTLALSATLYTPTAAVSDASGNVYIAARDSHQIVRIDPGGYARVIAGNGASGSSGDGGPATAASLMTPVGLAFDPAGNLCIADFGTNRIRCIGLDGNISAYAGSGAAGYTGDGGLAVNATFSVPNGIAFDSRGNLYIADTGNQVVRKVNAAGIISTFAGVAGVVGSSGDNGPALSAYLNNPQGVAVDGDNVYVSDTRNSKIRVITPDGIISRYAGYESSSTSSPFGGGGDTSMAVNYSLVWPTGLAVDASHNLYIAQPSAPRVLRVSPNGEIVSYAGTGYGGTSGDEGPATAANLYVMGIGVDRSGNLLIADGSNNRVRIVTAADGIIRTFAGDGLVPFAPVGLARNGSYLYISDTQHNRVRRLDVTSGGTALIAGTGYGGGAGDNGTALTANLYAPRGLAVESSGLLYIADSSNNRVRMVTPDGHIFALAGNGGTGATTDNVQATETTLLEPTDVAVDLSSNVYIVERSGHRVRKVTGGGIISTIAGTGVAGAPDAETGVATAQRLNLPRALALSASGDLYIADSGNHRVRKLSPAGTITTVAGNGASGSSGDGGLATAAALDNPTGLTLDSAGNLYIADANGQRIRRVSTDGIIETVAGNGAAGFNGDGSPATAYSVNGPAGLQTGADCSLYLADTSNLRVRQVWPAVTYSIATNPPGFQVVLDGQAATSPLTASLLPGTQHSLTAPDAQSGGPGVRYVPAGAQSITVACGPARAALTVNLKMQYFVTIVAEQGGSVTPSGGWQDAGSTVTLQAAPQSGYLFAGWQGDCTGTGTCTLQMGGPKNIKAAFSTAAVLDPVISIDGVAGAGLSVPAVRAISPDGLSIVYGSGFAPAGTSRVAGTGDLVNGHISTEMNGTCVLVGSTRAPILALTATQVNFQTPQGIEPGSVPIQVITGCGTASEKHSAAQTASYQSASPEFFYFQQTASGRNPIAAFNYTRNAYAGTPGLLSSPTFLPARAGDVIILYATGLGATAPNVAAGDLASAAANATGAIEVSVGSLHVPASNILYAGVAPGMAGVYQVNLRWPDGLPAGDQTVTITVNGFASPAGGYITVGQ